MVTKQQVRSLVDAGHSYESAAEVLGVSPGLAYLVATGRPADGSDAMPAGPDGRPHPSERTQHLSNPEPVEAPNDRDQIKAWVRHRALTDTTMQQAAAAAAEQDGD